MPTSKRIRPRRDASTLTLRLWEFTGKALLNLFVWMLALVFLSPLTYMLVTSLKTSEQLSDRHSPILPAVPITYQYEERRLNVYYVPIKSVGVESRTPTASVIENKAWEWALVDAPDRTTSNLIDPQDPEAGLIEREIYWRELGRVYRYHMEWGNFATLWDRIEYPRLLRNTLVLVFLGEIGILFSSIAVAYGFSRFRIPGGKYLFLLLIATIMIPDSITLVPTFFIYSRMLQGLREITSSPAIYYIPLLLPHFFGSAIYIFLLRQNFKAIPRDLDEAAMLDGAGPMRTLVSVVLPQAIPTVVTVGLLHFFNAWNEMRMASLFLGVSQERTIGFSAQAFQSYGFTPEFLQASAVLLMVIPIIVLLLSQRFFMQDMVVTGMEK